MLWAEGATNAKTHRLRRPCDRQKVTMMGPQSKVGINGRSRDVQADGPALYIMPKSLNFMLERRGSEELIGSVM